MPLNDQPRPGQITTTPPFSADDSTDTLFASDAAVLSDEAIQKILAINYKPPQLNRVALMPLQSHSWSRWSDALAIASDEMQNSFSDNLQASLHIYDASFLPTQVVPEKKTVPYVREAAARYQADLLIVYRRVC